ncbi:Os01g0103650, partial [Oryza sativa Japonica Group]
VIPAAASSSYPPPPPKLAPHPHRGQIEAAAPSRPHRVPHQIQAPRTELGGKPPQAQESLDPNHTDGEDGWRRG